MSGFDFEGPEAHEESVRIAGRVKWFDAGKGYGFIVPDDPSKTGLKDVLLHITSLRTSGRESALEGSVIVCDVVRRPKGWQVSEVVDLDEASAPPPMERAPRRFDDQGHGGFSRDRYSTPLHRTDTDGNTYQWRELDDGSRHEVVKNFPTPDEAAAALGPRAYHVQWTAGEHYWVLQYRLG